MSSIYDATDVLRDTEQDEEPVTTVISDLFAALESVDDIPTFDEGPSASAFISRPEMELDALMPEGPFTLRLMGQVYDEVYEDLMLQLLRRGLLAGAEVWKAPEWIPFSEHPDFGAIQAHMASEVERLVSRAQPRRDLTPQPHWRAPEITRESDREVTRPSVRLSEVEGFEFDSEGLDHSTDASLDHQSEPFDDSRETAEFDSAPFRAFAESEELSAMHRSRAEKSGNPFDDLPATAVNRLPEERVRQASPLEGTASPKTAFPIDAPQTRQQARPVAPPSAGSNLAGVEPAEETSDVPPAGILKRPRRKSAAGATSPQPAASRQAPSRVQMPTGAIRPGTAGLATSPAEPETRRVPTWLVYVTAIAVVVSIAAIAMLLIHHWTTNADASPHPAPTPAENALNAARGNVAVSVPDTFAHGRDVAAMAASLTDATAEERVWILSSLHAARPSSSSALEAARANLGAGELKTARSLAVEAVTLGGELDAAREVFAAALAQDRSFDHHIADVWEEVDGLEAADDHWVLNHGGSSWVFVPSTKDSPDAYRPLLAYDRLCALVTCGFDVPATERVSVTRAALEAATLETDAGIDLAELRWVSTSQGDIVDGAAYRALPEESVFPVDDEETWRPWLQPGELSDEDHGRLVELAGDARRAEGVRRSLANLLTIDFLTNNWSRIPEDGHITTRRAGDRLVSVQHGAVFATRSSKRVRGRFGWVERFDPRLIAELELLTPELVDHHLFLDGDPVSESRRDEFWSQREELLEAVEDAEQHHGDAVWL